MHLTNQPLTIAGRTFQSRLFLGTGKFASPEAMRDALAASGTEIVTVALRRADLSGQKDPFANILLARIRNLPIEIDGTVVPLTASAGVCVTSDPSQLASCKHRAVLAQLEAKKQGKDTFAFADDVPASSPSELP